MRTIAINGSYGEGGGQIVRTSLSLSVLTGDRVEVSNVRANRSRPGLQPQHLAAVNAAAALCDATLQGASVGSTYFSFEPRSKARAGKYCFEIGTAGAAPLVAQTVLVPLVKTMSRAEVVVTGGTHVPHAPTAEYLESIYLPILQRIGADAECSYTVAGFYPRGGGELGLRIGGEARLAPLVLTDRGPLVRLRAIVVTSNLPSHVAERGVSTVERIMKGAGRKVVVERRDRPSPGAGAAVVLVAECETGIAAFSRIGERGVPMEKVAEQPCQDFLAWWKTGAAVDEHLADQLVLPTAVAGGESRWTVPMVTEHLRTVLWVVRQFLPIEGTLKEQDDGTGVVTVRPRG